ncbi:MAG: hypothetical protein ACJAZV_002217 [Roseivirga sp.]
MKKVFLLAVSFFVFSCGEKEEIPEWLLSETQMVELLVDFRVAEGKVENLNIKNDSSALLFKILERKLFEEHQIDTTIYKNSYQYYILHPEKAVGIFDAVLDSLNLMQQRIAAGN